MVPVVFLTFTPDPKKSFTKQLTPINGNLKVDPKEWPLLEATQ